MKKKTRNNSLTIEGNNLSHMEYEKIHSAIKILDEALDNSLNVEIINNKIGYKDRKKS